MVVRGVRFIISTNFTPKSYEDYKEDDDFLQRMTNAISIYVLSVSKGYMDYLRKEVIG